MRLEKIKLCGFKSFVDNTVLDLNSNLVAVIGPNGCGKSNIIDAIRWVMGESSAKYLRGGSLTDVIFNGSANRKPLGQASVELVFDNSDGTIGGEYSNYSNISVKRILTRDGQSNYFLNSTRCRKKDITDVFLGTGLGARSYSIIEQGMISRVIEARPEELRNFVEEAAGISLYRRRRHETELRIKHTTENLERISDLKQEQDKLLEKLQKQSVAAQKFKEYKEEQTKLETNLLAIRWNRINEEEKESGEKIRTLAVELEKVLACKSSSDTELEQLKIVLHDDYDALKEVEKSYYELGNQIARLEQTITLKRERQQQLVDDLQNIKEDKENADTRLETDAIELQQLKIEYSEIVPKYEEESLKVETTIELHESATEEYEEITLNLESAQNNMNQYQQIAEVQKSKIAHIELQCRDYGNKLIKLKEEKESIDISHLELEVSRLEDTVNINTNKLNADKDILEKLNLEYDSNNQSYKNNIKLLNEVQVRVQELKGKKVSIETLISASLGKNDSKKIEWLTDKQLINNPRLSEKIEVESGWELACEIILSNYLKAVCVDDISFDLLETLECQMDFISDGSYDCPDGSILNKIKTSLNLGFISDVLFAENVSDALNITLSQNQSVITKDGVWLGNGWVKVYKNEDNSNNVLYLEKQLRETIEELEISENKTEEIQKNINEQDVTLNELKGKMKEISILIDNTNGIINKVNAEYSAVKAKYNHLSSRIEQIKQENIEYNDKLSNASKEMQEARIKQEDAVGKMAEFNDEYEELAERKDECKEKVLELSQSLKYCQNDLHELELKKQELNSKINNLSQNLENIASQKDSLASRYEKLKEQLREAEPDSELQIELDEVLSNQSLIEKDVTKAKEKVNSSEKEIDNLERARTEHEKQAQVIRSELEELKMSWQALDVRKQTIEEQFAEENIDLESAVKNLTEDINESELKEYIENLQEKIKRLGAINLAAVEEYEAEKERNEYIHNQFEDLTEALRSLEEAIGKIDKETKSKFKSTFETLNENFKALYPKLFKGGQAYLELTGDDLLETGVSVMARPPGKKNSTIHALSGGEKALTAIALVFAIFQLNPAPFCVLDEVDAPLDDANVVRYSSMVKEMSEKVQFIFISHNKLTMEIADKLAGVTMKEPGVSRLVSVDLEAAAEMVN